MASSGPVAPIPHCTSPRSHNSPFRDRNVHMYGHFCYKMVQCGVFVWCIVGFMRWVCFWESIFRSDAACEWGISPGGHWWHYNFCYTRMIARQHYNDVIMSAMASQVTNLTIVYSTVYSGADQRKQQSSVSLAFARGIHRWPVNSPHKGPVTRKMFPFDDIIMKSLYRISWSGTTSLD